MFRRLAVARRPVIAWLPLAQAQLPEPVASKLAANDIPQDAISVLVLRGDTTLAVLPGGPPDAAGLDHEAGHHPGRPRDTSAPYSAAAPNCAPTARSSRAC